VLAVRRGALDNGDSTGMASMPTTVAILSLQSKPA